MFTKQLLPKDIKKYKWNEATQIINEVSGVDGKKLTTPIYSCIFWEEVNAKNILLTLFKPAKSEI